MPHLKPVGHQSTNWTLRLFLIPAIALLTSLGTTSPRYNKQQAIYLPWRGSHLTIWLDGSKQELVISRRKMLKKTGKKDLKKKIVNIKPA
jgi:hypothetical protein